MVTRVLSESRSGVNGNLFRYRSTCTPSVVNGVRAVPQPHALASRVHREIPPDVGLAIHGLARVVHSVLPRRQADRCFSGQSHVDTRVPSRVDPLQGQLDLVVLPVASLRPAAADKGRKAAEQQLGVPAVVRVDGSQLRHVLVIDEIHIALPAHPHGALAKKRLDTGADSGRKVALPEIFPARVEDVVVPSQVCDPDRRHDGQRFEQDMRIGWEGVARGVRLRVRRRRRKRRDESRERGRQPRRQARPPRGAVHSTQPPQGNHHGFEQRGEHRRSPDHVL